MRVIGLRYLDGDLPPVASERECYDTSIRAVTERDTTVIRSLRVIHLLTVPVLLTIPVFTVIGGKGL